MRKIYESSRFNDKNAFSENNFVSKFLDGTGTYGRMCVYGRYIPEIITQIHQIFHVYTMMSDGYERASTFASPDDSDTYSIMS